MNDVPEIPSYLRDLFPEVGEDVLRLFLAGAENANLVLTDFLTIHDLLELAGYRGPESLHVLILCMLLALEEGSLCVEASLSGFERRLNGLVAGPEAKFWAARIVGDLEAGFPGLIGLDAREQKPIILRSTEAGSFLYFQKYLLHETIFRDALSQQLTAPALSPLLDRLKAVMKEALDTEPLRIDGRPLLLDKRQKLAVGLALLRDFVVISGGPGTGKTSIVLTLLRCLVRTGVMPERIALAAPTGRAAQRLTDALRTGLASLGTNDNSTPDEKLAEVSAHTLHRLLRYHPTHGTYGRHIENPIPADVIIVDEVSMVGIELMSRLLQATPPASKLILLGDKDQLPSVEAGAVLASLVGLNQTPGYSPALCEQLSRLCDDVAVPAAADSSSAFIILLEENYRSQPHIRSVARSINQQDTKIVESLPRVSLKQGEDNPAAPFLELEPQGGCWFWPQSGENVHDLRHALERWAQRQYLTDVVDVGTYGDLVRTTRIDTVPTSEQQAQLERLFQLLGGSRLLTLVREGPWGCVAINHFLEQLLRPHWDRAGRPGLFAGAPILVTQNDYTRQLFNGDVGIALRSSAVGLRVVFQRQAGYVSFPADSLPAHEPGFALTVHKSQGSEYGQVLIVLPPNGGRRLLTKEIIYTGITRAKQLAIILGTEEVLKFAIGRRIERDFPLDHRTLNPR